MVDVQAKKTRAADSGGTMEMWNMEEVLEGELKDFQTESTSGVGGKGRIKNTSELLIWKHC